MSGYTLRRGERRTVYTVAQVLHAIAREVARERPGGIKLASPDEVTRLFGHSAPPTVRLSSQAPATAFVRWARMLQGSDSVTVIGGTGTSVMVETTGQIPHGPRIGVTATVYDLVFDPPFAHLEHRELSLDEFAELVGGR